MGCSDCCGSSSWWHRQITERFTRAIDQLGSEHLDVRLGGLYALERIARDSPSDRASIGEVLTAFVRTHAPWPPSLPDQPAASAPIEQVQKLQVRAPDVQASLWVLGRGGFARALGQYRWLDLSAVDLRRADLRDAHLGDDGPLARECRGHDRRAAQHP